MSEISRNLPKKNIDHFLNVSKQCPLGKRSDWPVGLGALEIYHVIGIS